MSIATIQLARYDLNTPTDDVFHEREGFYLDLCLTPRVRNARACFHNRWRPHRFERLGDVFMVPSGEELHTRSDGGHQLSVVCELRPEAIREWFDGDLQWTDRRLEANLDIKNSSIKSLLLRLAEEVRNPGFASEALTELITSQMAIELGRYVLTIEDTSVSGGLASWCLRLVDERVNELGRAPTLQELAGLCNLSVRQLTRGFRTSRGCSIGDYMEQCRVRNAKQLLGTDESIKAVAYSMGFGSPSSFTCAFRRATGETPRQYRQRLRR